MKESLWTWEMSTGTYSYTHIPYTTGISFTVSYFVWISDVATVVGFSVVSRPFLNASSTRHINSTHSERMEVSWTNVASLLYVLLLKLRSRGASNSELVTILVRRTSHTFCKCLDFQVGKDHFIPSTPPPPLVHCCFIGFAVHPAFLYNVMTSTTLKWGRKLRKSSDTLNEW